MFILFKKNDEYVLFIHGLVIPYTFCLIHRVYLAIKAPPKNNSCLSDDFFLGLVDLFPVCYKVNCWNGLFPYYFISVNS